MQSAFVRSHQNPGKPHALLLANLDHFKVFNETMNASAGDQILVEIARRLVTHLQQGRTISRRDVNDSTEASLFHLGGDEFTILLEGTSDASDAMRVAKALQQVAAAPIDIDSKKVRVALSIGIAMNTPAHERAEDLLRWQHPTQGLISPYRFIEAAEDTGILVSIGHWLILQACRQLREWKLSGSSRLAMNATTGDHGSHCRSGPKTHCDRALAPEASTP